MCGWMSASGADPCSLESGMEAAKDLLKRAVDLESAQKFSEALVCYEEGVQNLLRVIGGQ